MYVRRKVFSILSDETGEERMFSTNEVEYLGYEDYELDDQKEFAESEDSKVKKAAKILGVSTAALGAAVVGGKLTGVGIRKVANAARKKAGISEGVPFSKMDKLNKLVKQKYAVEKPYDVIAGGVKSGYKKASEGVKAGYSKMKGAFNKEK